MATAIQCCASESFISGEKLFEKARKLKLEGIVSKRHIGTYHPARCDWVKVKTPEWKEANKDRGVLFGEEARFGG